jgi:hypothetical protein
MSELIALIVALVTSSTTSTDTGGKRDTPVVIVGG